MLGAHAPLSIFQQLPDKRLERQRPEVLLDHGERRRVLPLNKIHGVGDELFRLLRTQADFFRRLQPLGPPALQGAAADVRIVGVDNGEIGIDDPGGDGADRRRGVE